ncbi:pyruvate kinase [Desulfosarcina ovata subsp. sediminis]|uniref:Pyruvate kinase n=1 Tax=Desulfosarcina ovata subsp. sediminis TaxID=885957 RepID=A0A5K7ZSH9_9BACT|nr:pyruvate kinase [Desulfosarcina ovata]BBO83169.1 pyruvate kinase [Desulfosarcina ovata subsp. sediminis]
MAITLPKTKIVCTIGPASDTPEIIRELIAGGMRIARLNFSHGTHVEHEKKIHAIRKIAEELGKPVAILQDLGGPKIRVGVIPDPGIRLEPGRHIILTTQSLVGSQQRISVSYPLFNEQVKAGDRIMLADGFLELRVTSVSRAEIHCEIITGGVLTSHKGINLPTGSIRMPSMTDKDRDDLRFGLVHDVDYIALSFVRTAADIQEIKEIIHRENKHTPVIAKIEKHEAIAHYEEILDAADAIMVARGDLGVEIPLEEVPGIQKRLIQKANAFGKPVITATQMLRSMVDAPRPTRAEASDVANAVLDGTDAVMLSEETATGNYPVQALHYMIRIVAEAEKTYPHDQYLKMVPEKEISDAVTYAACVLADHLDTTAILAPTRSGRTAIHISRFRPKQPIIAFTPSQTTLRQLSLFRGIYPRMILNHRSADDLIEKVSKRVVETGDLIEGDLAVITAGNPIWIAGMTNMIRVVSL